MTRAETVAREIVVEIALLVVGPRRPCLVEVGTHPGRMIVGTGTMIDVIVIGLGARMIEILRRSVTGLRREGRMARTARSEKVGESLAELG